MTTQFSPQDIHDIKGFIEFFEGIEDRFWCAKSFYRGSARCAYGHLIDNNSETRRICCAKLFDRFGANIARVNDGLDLNYQQITPKQRILACLNSMLSQNIV